MPARSASVETIASCQLNPATAPVLAPSVDPKLEAQVMLADFRMDGVRFSRVREKGDFVFHGMTGAFTLCYLVRHVTVWLDVLFPAREPVTLELAPGAIVSLSGLIPHWFKFAPAASIERADPLRLERFDQAPGGSGALEMLVGYAPMQAVASSGLLSSEILVPPMGAERFSRRIWRAAEAIEDELINLDPLGGTDAVVRRYSEVIALNISRFLFSNDGHIGPPGFSAMRDPRLMRAMAAVASNPVAPWTVASLAQIAGMSRTAFSQTFHALTGTTPMQCVGDLRLNCAADALAESTHNLEQVAARIGYGSSEALIRAFRRRYGVTPGWWRDHGGARL